MEESAAGSGPGTAAGAGLNRYRVVHHLVREPWNSQEVRVRAGTGLDCLIMVHHLVRETLKSQVVRVGVGEGLDRYRVA